jgi:diguanylate cyclase (GGDEF)-like protein
LKSGIDIMQEARQRLKSSNLPGDEQERLLDLITKMMPGLENKDIDDGNITDWLIEIIANQGHLLTIIDRQVAELDALKRITRNLTSSLELQTVLDAVVTEAMHLVKGSHEAHIYLYQNDKLSFAAALDETGAKDKQMSEPRPNGLTNTVAGQKQLVIVEDMVNHPLFENAAKPWSGSVIGIPLMMSGAVVGVMNLIRSHVGSFSHAEVRLLTLLADQAAIAISNARLHQAVNEQAHSDTLTSLPNRRALDERLDEAIDFSNRTNQTFSVVMFDLDGFKAINDTYGHEVGDDVLRQLATFLLHHLRSTDFLARYGGDEMTLVLPNTDLTQASHVCNKFQNQLQKLSIQLPDKKPVTLGVSGGIAHYPMHATTASGLLRAADEALYRAKKHARGTFVTARAQTGDLQPLNRQLINK